VAVVAILQALVPRDRVEFLGGQVARGRARVPPKPALTMRCDLPSTLLKRDWGHVGARDSWLSLTTHGEFCIEGRTTPIAVTVLGSTELYAVGRLMSQWEPQGTTPVRVSTDPFAPVPSYMSSMDCCSHNGARRLRPSPG
jgi:hypothetical protein